MTPRVSVVLPVFNAGPTLAAALDSLLQQDLDAFEVLAVDDGSSDDTPEILTAYAAKDARVRHLRRPHAGLVAALNHGLASARSAYVARMDGDDICLPERLQAQCAFLDSTPHIGLVGCRVAFGGDRRRCAGYARYVDWTNRLLTPEQIALERFRESPFAHPSVMFRLELVTQYGGYAPGDFPEDYELWLRWLDQGVRMAKLDRFLLVWNDPPGRLSRTDERYSVDNFYALKTCYLARWLQRNNPSHPRVLIMGAGRPTRKRADLLQEHGIEIAAYVDIDPKKIGKRVNGRPVISRDELPSPGNCFVLSYVGSHGASRIIREFLEQRGYRMGRDFLLAA